MLVNRFFFLLFLLLMSCINNPETTEINTKNQLETPHELKSGYFEKRYPNGNLWSTCYYKDGKKNGKVATYYSNGNLRYIGHYKNDKKTDVWLFYNEDGSFAKEVNFNK